MIDQINGSSNPRPVTLTQPTFGPTKITANLERITASLEIGETINPVLVTVALEKMGMVLYFDGAQDRALEAHKARPAQNHYFCIHLTRTPAKPVIECCAARP
jgi:hypothetical protein